VRRSTPTHRAAHVRAQPASVAPADDAAPPPRFVMAMGTIATRLGADAAAAGAPASAGQAAAGPLAAGGDVAGEGDVDVPARLLSTSALVYPPAARNAEIETDVPVEIVVDLDGRVASARGLTRAGYGLDEAALRAIRGYRFSPALRGGRPIRVRMRWIVQFRLR
jgi:protein TonB